MSNAEFKKIIASAKRENDFNDRYDCYMTGKDRITIGTRLKIAHTHYDQLGKLIKNDIMKAINDEIIPFGKVSVKKERRAGFAVKYETGPLTGSFRNAQEGLIDAILNGIVDRYDRNATEYYIDSSSESYGRHSVETVIGGQHIGYKEFSCPIIDDTLKKKTEVLLAKGLPLDQTLEGLDRLGYVSVTFANDSLRLAGLSKEQVYESLKKKAEKLLPGMSLKAEFSMDLDGAVNISVVKKGFFDNEGEKFSILRIFTRLLCDHSFSVRHASGAVLQSAVRMGDVNVSAEQNLKDARTMTPSEIVDLKPGDYVRVGKMHPVPFNKGVHDIAFLDIGLVIKVSSDYFYVAICGDKSTKNGRWLDVYRMNRKGKYAGFVNFNERLVDKAARSRTLFAFQKVSPQRASELLTAQRANLHTTETIPDPKTDNLLWLKPGRVYDLNTSSYWGGSSWYGGKATLRGNKAIVKDEEKEYAFEAIQISGKAVVVAEPIGMEDHILLSKSWER